MSLSEGNCCRHPQELVLTSFPLGFLSELAELNYEELERLRWSAGKAGPNITEKGYAADWGLIARQVLMRMQITYWRNVSYVSGANSSNGSKLFIRTECSKRIIGHSTALVFDFGRFDAV